MSAAQPAGAPAIGSLDAMLAGFALPDALAVGDGRPRVPTDVVPSSNPTASFVIQPRDLGFAGLVGFTRELRFEVARTFTFKASASVFARRLGKLQREGLVVCERVCRTGFGRVRITAKGRALLVELGVAAEADLFVPRAFLPLKDMVHGHFVAGLTALLLADTGIHFDAVFPSWLLQRRLSPAPAAIPDILAVRSSSRRPPGMLWALEVDCGGERIRGQLVPKLALLARDLRSWANGGGARIVIFTRGAKRLAALQAAVTEAALPVPVTADLLPSDAGREGVEELRRLLSPPAKSSSHPAMGDLP